MELSSRNKSLRMHASYHVHCSCHFARRMLHLEISQLLLSSSSSSYFVFDVHTVVDEYRAQNKIGIPIPVFAVNKDMQASTNTVGKGSTSLSFSLSFSHTYIHIFARTHSRSLIHSLFLPLSLSFSLSISLSISSSLSATCEHFNGTISPFVGNGAFGDAIRRATR